MNLEQDKLNSNYSNIDETEELNGQINFNVQQKSKTKEKIIFIISITLIVCALLTISVYSFTVKNLQPEAIISLVALILLLCGTLARYFYTSTKYISQIYIVQLILSGLVFLGILIDVIIYSVYYNKYKCGYGPLGFVFENGTRIHWYTEKQVETHLKSSTIVSDSRLSNYHEAILQSDSFDFKLRGLRTRYSYALPKSISKFIVMTDIHTNNSLTSNMSTDFDLMVFCGDQSDHGLPSDYVSAFKNFPQKPMLMAMGNHDEVGDFLIVNGRPKNFYQKVRNLGFYFIHVQRKTPIVDDQVDLGIEFLNQNVHLSEGTEHVFIVVHYPVYSAGYFGAYPYFTKKLEEFIDQNEGMNIRAVFYGHDHNFGAFKRKQQYFIEAGVGGGGLSELKNETYLHDRVWTTDSRHGPLEVPVTCTQACYGYEHHLDSWMKYTRTEVNFEPGKIVYNIRDLITDEILTSYEQPV
ncbi:Alkaline_phosphatase [Hexamita inflata]|uniref:Alkaline phosphatase n=1 Tax=Hexamita inflata TaxID=28002 RepID=A0AA86NRD0_9EUKA|nr:Alkaline phosphatase [Hexamita inflata]